jgi:hypothetical protein
MRDASSGSRVRHDGDGVCPFSTQISFWGGPPRGGWSMADLTTTPAQRDPVGVPLGAHRA